MGDNGSKFGTLALIKNDFVIKPNSDISIQIGRTVITFTLINKSSHNHENSGMLSSRSFSSLDMESNENGHEFARLQYLFQKKDVNFQKLIETVEKVKLDAEMNRSNGASTTTRDEALTLNSKLFSLTLNKDKDDYRHFKELIESNGNEKMISSNLLLDQNKMKNNDDAAKVRERKNILNEMKNLNINSDDEEEDEENSEEDDIEEIIIEPTAFKL